MGLRNSLLKNAGFIWFCLSYLWLMIIVIRKERMQRRKWIVYQSLVLRYEVEDGEVKTIINTMLRVIIARTEAEAVVKFIIERDRLRAQYKKTVEPGPSCYREESIIPMK